MVEVQLTPGDPDELKIGQHLEMVTRKLLEHEEGLIVYGHKFRPVANGN